MNTSGQSMIVFLNGRFVRETDAVVSAFDRGFLYGDGIFETLRVVRGLPFQWDAHLARLARGADLLGILAPMTAGELRLAAARLVALNAMPDSVLRITLTRGAGPRGYSPKGANAPTLVMTLHPAPRLAAQKPKRVRLITATIRVAADDPLARVKTCNKLPYILARAEAEAAGVEDALLLNTRGEIAEATASNIFWFERERLFTPSSRTGILPGITRGTVCGLAHELGLRSAVVDELPGVLRKASGAFLTNSVSGIVEVSRLDGVRVPVSPWTRRLQAAYARLLRGASAS